MKFFEIGGEVGLGLENNTVMSNGWGLEDSKLYYSLLYLHK